MNWNKYLNAGRLRPSTRTKELDSRNEFESDLGRVIFSPAIRRMHDKTQVFPLTDNDNIHSRLTHSLEVMSVGYSIALNLSQNEDFLNKVTLENDAIFREIPIIIKSACLVHDIGNPPFGHFGEFVIQDYFKKRFAEKDEKGNARFDVTPEQQRDFTFFDGNAQGFRVLTKLQFLDDIYGLNLTYATLASFLKYPNADDVDKKFLYRKKRGVFESERSFLDQIIENCDLSVNGKNIRHPLSFIMEAADSICYLVMDIEDAFNKKWFDFPFIKREMNANLEIRNIIEKIEERKDISENKKVVNFRLELIKYLVDLAVRNFIHNVENICNGDYNRELIFDDQKGVAAMLNDFSYANIYAHKEITDIELTGYSVLRGLLDFYVDFCFNETEKFREKAVASISNSILKAALMESGVEEFDQLSDYYKLKVIVDFISGMTDQYALNQFKKISGQKIN
ncbi:dNTP triphosphohydrolase [Bacteroidales bacterium OttesenSCG-928-B11]|nr:dNTP triphosphohydrolase [Bacteroidales bacterium OttesenSCG-928-B11]